GPRARSAASSAARRARCRGSAATPARLAFAIPAAAGALVLLHNQGQADRPRLDILGALTATTGLVAVVYGFSHAQTDGWGDAVTVAMLAGGAALLALFAWLESRLANPLLPLRV